MKKALFVLSILFLFLSCITETKTNKNQKNKVAKVTTSKKQVKQVNKRKVGANNYVSLLSRSKKYADNLKFDLDYIRSKGLPDKKYLAEFLGLYLKLKKGLKSKSVNKEIKKRLTPFYQETLKPNYHNMGQVDDKLFKKNSMSYMRIMWLLDQLGFDISLHKKELAKIKNRMDNHMVKRGPWQRAVFDWYYDYFNIVKPKALKNAKQLKGAIGTRKELSFYNRQQAYVLTHFVFAAYDYGNKLTQSRFTKEDIAYLKKILPQIITKFELKRNDDIVGELLTCQVLIGDTKTSAFKKSYKRLMSRQNNDGSFGGYENYRTKVGDDVEFRAYLHTTLVCLETFVEFEERKSVFN
jgi:hypothetical protein